MCVYGASVAYSLAISPHVYCTILYDIEMLTVSFVSSDTESLCAKYVSLRLSLSLGSSILYSVYGKEQLHVFGLLSQVASLSTHRVHV